MDAIEQMRVNDIAELAARLDSLPWDAGCVPAPLVEALARAQLRRKPSGGLPAGGIEYQLLAALGLSGWSVRADLVQAVNGRKGLHPRSGTYLAGCRRLETSGLWQVHAACFSYRRVALVRLTERGRALLAAVGLATVRSEWERLEAAHGGPSGAAMRHTAAVCLFLHFARARGYVTEACPQDDWDNPAAPDARLDRAGERCNVEVQGRGGDRWRKARKWRNLGELPGHAAICALTPRAAARLAREAQVAGLDTGCATDLQTLIHAAPAALWTLRWRSVHGPLEPVVEPEALTVSGSRQSCPTSAHR